MADYITTYTKIHFYPTDPKMEDIDIQDIAHALSLMTRANGHFPVFYSVAQHCMACAIEARERGYSRKVQLACLLHDASEAYLSDITRPVKKELSEYVSIEKNLQDAIYKKYLGEEPTEDMMQKITSVDDTLLYYEFYHFMGEKLKFPNSELLSKPEFLEKSMKEMEEKYLNLFVEIEK